jgi:hypothetical protein
MFRDMEAVEGIRAFWTWWATARHRVLKAIEVDGAFSDELVEDISNHVAGIGDLDWELGAGTTSRHAFFLSAKGNAEGRLITELWRSMGPAPDDEWSYFPARQARRGFPIELEGVRLDPEELRAKFEVETSRERVHGSFFLPAFAKLEEDSRAMALFLLLDGEFGEDGVERWLGGIDVLDDATDTKPFAEFRAAVDELARTATGFQGAILQGETDIGEPLFVMANLALKRIDHLLHTTHLAIEIAILDQNENGLPTNAEAEKLNAIEDELEQALTDAVHFCRETRPGLRTMHWYVPEDSTARSVIERWSKEHADRKPEVMFAHDPTWEFVKRY